MRNSAVSIAAKKASALPPPTQKVDCYRSFEEFEKRVTKLHLPDNWQMNSSSDYDQILKHDTIHDIPIFDIYIYIYIYYIYIYIYIKGNLKFTNHVFAVCIPTK